MKPLFKTTPFAAILLAFLLGFLPANVFSYAICCKVLLVLVLVSLMLCGLFYLTSLRLSWRGRFIPGISLLIMVSALGTWLSSDSLHKAEMPSENRKICCCLKILEMPKEKERSVQCVVRVLSVADSISYSWQGKKLMLTLPKDSSSSSLKIGESLYAYFHPSPIRNFSSTDGAVAFDYAGYMKKKGFSACAYVSRHSWKKTNLRTSFQLKTSAHQYREQLLTIFRRSGISGNNLALVSALILGKKDLMDQDMKNQFASAGVAHILAVSGMHVGIIYMIINTLFSFLNRRRAGMILKQVLIIVLLWMYALLTGLSASVVRAVLMFSLVAVGTCLNRKAFTWNTLCFSAFIMLCINPLYIYDVGFQLSYVAVASILWLLPVFQQLYPTEKGGGWSSKAVNYLYEMMSLSMAAQIGTAPLSIYYFHQFPNYFLLSNLVLVPLSVFITYNALALMLLSFVPFLEKFLSSVLDGGLSMFCRIAEWIDALPYAVSDRLMPTEKEMVLVYVFFLLLFFLSRNNSYIYCLNQMIINLRNTVYAFKNYRRRSYSKN